MRSEDSLPWLVKSSGRIMGPYTLAQIEELLKTREIVVLDEAAQPMRRFRYLRDIPMFHQIIEDMRKEATGDTGDKTFTGTTDSQTASLTEPVSAHMLDELTDEMNFPQRAMNEIVYDNIVEESSKPKTSPVVTTRYQSGASMGNQTINQKADSASKLLWIVTGLVIVVVLGFIGYKKMVQAPMETQASAKDFIASGEQLVVEGRLPEALEIFKKAYTLAPKDTTYLHYLGPLIIQYEGQTVVGRRILEQALAARPDFKPQLLTSMGIADYKDGSRAGAENYFRKALEQNPDYSPAMVNLGVLAMRSKEYAKARALFEKAGKEQSSDRVVPLLLAKSMVMLAQVEQKFSLLKDAIRVLTAHKNKYLAYRQEALLLIAYLQVLTEQKVAAEETVSEFLDIDPMATDLHTHNIFVIRDPLKWEELLAYCLPLTRALNATGRVAAMTGLCYLKANKPQEANTEIQTALQRSPRDPLVQAVSAYVLSSIGQEQSGSVALGKALEFDRSGEFELPLILQGKFYSLSGDFVSAKEYFKRLLNTESKSLEANAGLAKIAFQEEKKEDFKRFIWAAHGVANDYIPVTSLITRARKLNWEF